MENLDKISVHSIFFNVIKTKLEYKDALTNFCQFGDEVVICVNIPPEEIDDGTWDAFNQWKIDNQAKNLKLIKTTFSINDIFWFGKLKNTALQATKYNYKVLLDGDERVPVRDKNRWLAEGKKLQASKYKGILIPSLDLYGDLYSIRWDEEKNFLNKWYLHLPGCFRGAVRQGVLPNGKINYKITSTDELIDENSNVYMCPFLVSKEIIMSRNRDLYLDFIKNHGIFVFHLGYVDLEYKAKINLEVWNEYHNVMTGNIPTNLPRNLNEMFRLTFPHNQKLWDEF